MSGPNAEELQASYIVRQKTEKWCRNLERLMRRERLTQSAFAKKINARFFGSEERFSQKTVSNWMNVGRPDRQGHVRPFPKYEIMLQIANVLEVDVEHLTGDIECETRSAQNASEYTGLDEDAIKQIRSITLFERCQAQSQAVFSSLLAFRAFWRSLADWLLCTTDATK